MRLFLITYATHQTAGHFFRASVSSTTAQIEGRSILKQHLQTEAFTMEAHDILDRLQTVDAHLLPFLGEWAHELTAAVDAAKQVKEARG